MIMAQRLHEVTYKSFEAIAGQVLTLVLEQGAEKGDAAYRFALEEVRVNRRLAEATNAGQPGSVYQRIPFAITLRALEEPPFVQAVLRLDHDGFEDCSIMITRVVMPGRDPGMAWFEAVFG
jgi:hypothetical protein